MIRKIIQIDQNLCNGCGACAEACHERAIAMESGKARLLREDYCDGLGDCLPACPADAITFVEREAAPYDAAAVQEAKKKKNSDSKDCGCPGSQAKKITRESNTGSQLSQWPVQIRLMPVSAPYYDGAGLLIAADCTAYACGDFHQTFIKDRVTVIGCPKLDDVNYAEKLTSILQENDIQSITLVRMEVPCCGGLEQAARAALSASGKPIPFRTAVISADGRVVSFKE